MCAFTRANAGTHAAADAVRKNWSRAVLQQSAPVVMDPGLRRDDGGGFRCFGANHAADAGLATDNAQKIALARRRFRDSKMRKIPRWSLSMRVPTLASLMIVIGLMAAPAWAQT